MDSGLSAALRIVSGFAGAAGAGWLALDLFRAFGLAGPARISVLDPSRPGFQCLSTGLLFAAMLAFVRVGKPAVCLLIAVAASAMQFGIHLTGGFPRVLTRPLWMAVVAAVLVLAAFVYDALAKSGYRFGKFLVVGPIVAGVFFFATPLLLLGGSAREPYVAELLLNGFLGLVLGDGAALGVEIAEGVMGRGAASAASDSGL